METNLLKINTEIESQPHKMWAEGTCDNEPTEAEVIAFMDGQMWEVNNVTIWHDDMQGFWRWNSKLVKPLFTNEEYLDLHGSPDGVYPPPTKAVVASPDVETEFGAVKIAEYKINKYATYVSNLQWHLDTNHPTGERLDKINTQLSCYKEIISDLREIIKR